MDLKLVLLAAFVIGGSIHANPFLEQLKKLQDKINEESENIMNKYNDKSQQDANKMKMQAWSLRAMAQAIKESQSQEKEKYAKPIEILYKHIDDAWSAAHGMSPQTNVDIVFGGNQEKTYYIRAGAKLTVIGHLHSAHAIIEIILQMQKK